jgi:palmitoyltransferase
MDHHCPWLASKCIGLRNHKAFFLFLAYTSLLCCFAALDTGRNLLRYVEDVPNGYETAPITWAIILFLGGIFGLALVPFSGYHAYLICRNRTTLESMEGAGRVRISVQRPSNLPPREDVSDRLRKLAGRSSAEEDRTPRQSLEANNDETWRRDEQLTREERRTLRRANKLNIYNVGVRRNWQFIMGGSWPMWLVPLGNPISDGQSYEVNEATLKELEQTTAQIRKDQAGRVQRRQIERDQLAADTPSPQRFAGAFQSDTPSPTVSSVRGHARPAMHSRMSSEGNSAVGRAQVAAPPHERHQSAHGVVQWGARPKKDFVLFGLGDDDEDSGGVLGRASSSSNSQIGTQMDADVWSS